MILKGASPLNYEQLLTTADQNDLVVKEQPLTDHDGLLRGKRIAIRKDIETQAEKSCVLAEEIGHHCTSSGDILDQTDIMNRKQEYRARFYGYNLKIGLTGLIRAYEAGCRNFFEMAEFLDATEEYLKALELERKRVEKEELKFVSEIEKAKASLEQASSDEEVQNLKLKILELQQQLSGVTTKKEEIVNLQNGKAGNVYIISNLGRT